MKHRISTFLFSIILTFVLCGACAAAANRFEKVTFKSKDGLIITADLYDIGDRTRPVILLFHQYMSSRGEYRKIAPLLVEAGFNCLAVDTRAGGRDNWNGVENETTSRSPEVPLGSYLLVYPDLVAALNYVKEKKYMGRILVWGSSFSATLVFKLADEYKNSISAILSFSPGEYLRTNPGIVSKWASTLRDTPCFVTCGVDENELAKPIFNSIPCKNKTFYLPKAGRHGSSILMDDEKNWAPVKKFLGGFK
jgi:pimeloyl-ACP methyl ester carboxylesterase